MGKADAQVGGLIADYPGIKTELESIRENIRLAEKELQSKEEIIDTLSKAVTRAQEKADGRLATIWKLTSALLGILLVLGAYLAWKLK